MESQERELTMVMKNNNKKKISKEKKTNQVGNECNINNIGNTQFELPVLDITITCQLTDLIITCLFNRFEKLRGRL